MINIESANQVDAEKLSRRTVTSWLMQMVTGDPYGWRVVNVVETNVGYTEVSIAFANDGFAMNDTRCRGVVVRVYAENETPPPTVDPTPPMATTLRGTALMPVGDNGFPRRVDGE